MARHCSNKPFDFEDDPKTEHDPKTEDDSKKERGLQNKRLPKN